MNKANEKTFLTLDEIDQMLRNLRRATVVSIMVAGPDDGSNEPPSFSRDTLFTSMQIILEELAKIHNVLVNCGKQNHPID